MEKEPKIELMEDSMPGGERITEEILDILRKANETMEEVEITVSNLYGDRPGKKAKVLIDRVNERVLWLTTEKGTSMEIELSRVKKARIIKE